MDQRAHRAPVDYVIEQLWRPALQSRHLRVRVNPSPDPEWVDAERYWLLPSEQRARFLIQQGPKTATTGLLTNYRRLRDPRMNLVRAALGKFAQTGIPMSPHSVVVQYRRSNPQALGGLPMPMTEQALGGAPLVAALGVRTSDNRKTTLQLAYLTGEPAGFAKFGWSASTNERVANETRTLRRLGEPTGAGGAPAVLAEFDYHGNAVCVTAPLPFDVRRLSAREPMPAPQEFYDLIRVGRQDRIANSGHFRRLRDRLIVARRDDVTSSIGGHASELAEQLAESEADLPIAHVSHGDLTPWNAGRDDSGKLWIWDWEDADDDALAGLDSLHWCVATARLAGGTITRVNLGQHLQEASSHLTALGISPSSRGLVACCYALTVVDRACSLARAAGHWRDALIQPDGLLDLLGQAKSLADADLGP